MDGCRLKYRFAINDVPPSANIMERASYRSRALLRSKWEALFRVAMTLHGIPTAAGKRRITYTVWFGYQGRHDPLNLTTKGFIDAMTRSGLILDDSPRWLEIELPTVGLALGDKHTEFVVEDLNGPDL
jgi:hypothetical protein